VKALFAVEIIPETRKELPIDTTPDTTCPPLVDKSSPPAFIFPPTERLDCISTDSFTKTDPAMMDSDPTEKDDSERIGPCTIAEEPIRVTPSTETLDPSTQSLAISPEPLTNIPPPTERIPNILASSER